MVVWQSDYSVSSISQRLSDWEIDREIERAWKFALLYLVQSCCTRRWRGGELISQWHFCQPIKALAETPLTNEEHSFLTSPGDDLSSYKCNSPTPLKANVGKISLIIWFKNIPPPTLAYSNNKNFRFRGELYVCISWHFRQINPGVAITIRK